MTALFLPDRVQENAANIGNSSPITLTGATAPNRTTFANAGADGKTVPYSIEHPVTAQWENGYGLYTSSTKTLTRVAVLSNSSGTTSLINFSAGTVVVSATLSGKLTPTLNTDGSFPVTGKITVTADAEAIRAQAATSTARVFATFANGTGNLTVGVESSTGGAIFSGATPYSSVIGNSVAAPLYVYTNGSMAIKVATDQTLVLPAYGSGGGAVSEGPTDSGGSGYRMLRVPN